MILGIDNLLYLAAILFLPLLGSLLLAVVPQRAAKRVALLFSGLLLLLAAGLVYEVGGGGVRAGGLAWYEPIGLRFALKADALNLWLVALTAILLLIAVLAPTPTLPPTSRGEDSPPAKLYYGSMLALATGMLGVFLSDSIFLFYIFWEAMLIPAYFLVSRFAGPRAGQIALRFLIYTIGGGLLMLTGLIGLGAAAASAGLGFNPDAIFSGLRLGAEAQGFVFAAVVAGVMVKIPLFPFHSWLPDVYGESPAPVVVLIAGVMSKTGIYALLRYGVLMLPEGARGWQPLIAGMAVGSILYGALNALGATSLQRLVAYISLSHMGFLALGAISMTADGMSGAILQSFNHGIIIAAMFLIAGMMQQRVGSTELAAFGGWGKRLPVFATLFLLFSLATLGLPGLSGFSGEFMIMLGAYRYQPLYAILALVGVVLAAWYAVRLYQNVMHGPDAPPLSPAHPGSAGLVDARGAELLVLLPLLLLIVLVGVAPWLLTNSIVTLFVGGR